MVLLWNQLAGGSSEFCAILVAVNSVLQIVLFSPLALFYLQVPLHSPLLPPCSSLRAVRGSICHADLINPFVGKNFDAILVGDGLALRRISGWTFRGAEQCHAVRLCGCPS